MTRVCVISCGCSTCNLWTIRIGCPNDRQQNSASSGLSYIRCQRNSSIWIVVGSAARRRRYLRVSLFLHSLVIFVEGPILLATRLDRGLERGVSRAFPSRDSKNRNIRATIEVPRIGLDDIFIRFWNNCNQSFLYSNV